ncbi:endocuticle structural glycoprotein SgAbd-5-like [Maniola hyperantus]|uniref:endocuticle structural glycoprotein SgAbd-5-like n=1 Tax=Aphantopus hyperantus TaxID=2795564 RepID=UPI00156A2CBE|nr:endocuticle structural glycoprotein SgAbd-5-like [Maniola hyperantus]
MFKARCLLVVCSLIVLATAVPLAKDSEAKILNNEYTIDEKGNYEFSFKTSNGITREETGSIVNEGQPDEYILVIGRYTYFNTEGQEEIVEYTAGENGYNISPPKPVDMPALGVPPNVVATLLGK